MGKRFNRKWIFRQFDWSFEKGVDYAVLGPNGSGKSTLIRVLSTQLGADEGSINYPIPAKQMYSHINYTAPYIDIPEELSFNELLKFHKRFREARVAIKDIPSRCGLNKAADFPIKEFSSGMLQRVKLSLSLYFKADLILFDEPCSHLDTTGFEWFREERKILSSDITIIASNTEKEYEGCRELIEIMEYKT